MFGKKEKRFSVKEVESRHIQDHFISFDSLGAYPQRVRAHFRGQKPAVCGHSRTVPGFLL